MEYSPKEGEPFDPGRYWRDKMEGLTSSEMLEVSKKRAKLFVDASNRVHGRPPALTSSVIDTLMSGYPTDREIELWINASKPVQETKDDRPVDIAALGKRAAEKFDAAGRPMGGAKDD